MKRFLIILLILITWYLAAMYHLVSLMALAAAQCLILACCFVLSRYLKRHLTVSFARPFLVLTKNQNNQCPILIQNTGRLPAGKLRLRILASYQGGKEKSSVSFNANSGDAKEEMFYVGIKAPWCGLMSVSVDRADAYDYLSLFRGRAASGGKADAAVLPEGRAMKLRMSDDPGNQTGHEQDAAFLFGSGSGEIRQLREYSAGDSSRMIHWNQTARTDTLWVKERDPEEERVVSVYLDLHSEKQPGCQELDAFFEVLAALTAGLLGERYLVHVLWKEEDGLPAEMNIGREDDCHAMLLRLYQNKNLFNGDLAADMPKDQGICLDLNLTLFSRGREVYRFSAERCEEELEQMVFIL